MCMQMLSNTLVNFDSLFHVRNAELSDVPGLTITSNPLSPIVFFKLKKSTGSLRNDLLLLENVVEKVKELHP